MEETIKTQIHTYSFNISNNEEAKEYAELVKKLSKTRKLFNVISSGEMEVILGEVELEIECIFNNQWNTPTQRVFDWYEKIYPNKNFKKGHWLEITEEMTAIRANTLKCGYCGAHYFAQQDYILSAKPTFCDKCLDSEYLEENNLLLLRLLPVSAKQDRPELTEAELGRLMPQYIERQTTGSDSRNANKLKNQRLDIIAELKKTVETAHDKHDGFIWLMDNGVNIDNCIYYDHTNKFCFGWRSPVLSFLLSMRSKGVKMTFEKTIHTLRSGNCKKCGEYFNWRNHTPLEEGSLNEDRLCKECWENRGNARIKEGA